MDLDKDLLSTPEDNHVSINKFGKRMVPQIDDYLAKENDLI